MPGIWDNWLNCYKIWLFDDNHKKVERRGKFGIYFEYYKKYMLSRGISEKIVDELFEYLKSFTERGFSYNESKESNFIEKYIDYDGLTDKYKNQIVEDLVFLISTTKDKIDGLLMQE